MRLEGPSEDPADHVFWQAQRPLPEGDVDQPTPLLYPMLVLKVTDHQYLDFSPQCMQPQTSIAIHVSDRMRGDTFKESQIYYLNFYGQLYDEISAVNYAELGLVVRAMKQTLDPMPTRRMLETKEFAFWVAEMQLNLGAEF